MSQPSPQALTAQEALARHALACAQLDWSNSARYPEDQLYGLFQCFMPHGEGVAKVFEGLGDPLLAQALLQRLMPIYSSTSERTEQAFEAGYAPGYFVPRSDASDSAQAGLVALGEQQLANWRSWAQGMGDASLQAALAKLARVELVRASRHDAAVTQRREAAETHQAVHDALFDWFHEQMPDDALMDVMSEAYYAIACDYWVSYHLQAPALQPVAGVPHMPDLLAPNFELYLRGCSLVLTEDALLVTQDNLPETGA